MERHEFFEKEIELIKDQQVKEFVKYYLDNICPSIFFTCAASESGKHHPAFAKGQGGLIRHTKAVVLFALDILRMSSYAYMKELHKDYVIAACILHDTCKYGKTESVDKDAYPEHAKNAAELVASAWVQYFNDTPSEFFTNAIRSHMGQWSTDKEDRPFTSIDRAVHLADYMASRDFISIPSIETEWADIYADAEIDDEPTPFD